MQAIALNPGQHTDPERGRDPVSSQEQSRKGNGRQRSEDRSRSPTAVKARRMTEDEYPRRR